MFRKLCLALMFALFALVTTTSFGQAASANTAYLRFLQSTSDNTMISVVLEGGRPLLSNFAPGSVSDYLTFDANHSTSITLAITPPGRQSFFREWAVPPLAAGYHTAAVVGSGGDNAVQVIFIDEDTLCADKLAAGSCVILVNSLNGSPSLRVLANQTPVVDNVAYRQAVAGGVPAATYEDFTAADQNNPQTPIFHLQVKYFEPNTVYIYSVRGTYPGTIPQNYTIGSVRRVAVDSMTFLRSLKANLQLSDGTTLFAAENIVAILEQSGFDQLLQNSALPLTIFAPTDQAILKIAPDIYQCVMANPAAMRALILNHVLVDSHTPAQLVNAGSSITMAGTTHTFRATSGGFLIDNTVSVPGSAWYPTRNGNVYLIDTVLVPEGFADQYCVSG